MHKLLISAIAIFTLCMLTGMVQAETRWTPTVGLSVTHDDNVLFETTDEQDDYMYSIEPGVAVEHNGELTQFEANSHILIRRYQDNDELNDEVYRLDLKGDTKFTERFKLNGRYKYIKDNTLDSELEETGRIFIREDRFSHDAELAPSFNLTERTSVGLAGRYRNVDYDSDTNVDYSESEVSLPVRWRLATQRDTVYINPGYTYRDSDENRSKTYNMRFGWDHKRTERLTFNLSAGARYTEHESLITDTTEETWGGLANLRFNYAFETGRLLFNFINNLRNSANGDQVNVSNVGLRLKWNFTERMGMELAGRYIYTQTEGGINDDTTEYIQAGPELFYQLTENHIVYIAYDHSQENKKDIEPEQRTERNRIWAGVRLNFPIN